MLVGRNGTGKSTLLKAIADGLIPGIPWNTRILLLGQTRVELDEEMDGMKIAEETVLQHVLRSDRVRERHVREAKILSIPMNLWHLCERTGRSPMSGWRCS
jgi:ATP-binding cassette subfamily F protein 3